MKGTSCAGAGIGTHEVRGTNSSGRVAVVGGEVDTGGMIGSFTIADNFVI